MIALAAGRAETEIYRSSQQSAARLEDIMNIRVISVREGTKVDELLNSYFNQYYEECISSVRHTIRYYSRYGDLERSNERTRI